MGGANVTLGKKMVLGLQNWCRHHRLKRRLPSDEQSRDIPADDNDAATGRPADDNDAATGRPVDDNDEATGRPVDDNDEATGKKMFNLFVGLGFPNWVHRRVEKLEILPSGDCIRHQSVDFTLPAQYAIEGSKNRVLLPVSLMKKGPLSNFSAVGPEGRPISVLQSEENGRVAVALLLGFARVTYQYPQAFQDDDLRNLLTQIVLGPPNNRNTQSEFYKWESKDILKTLAKRVDQHLNNRGEPAVSAEIAATRSTFRAIRDQFWSSFLLVFEVTDDCVDQRAIVKFSYREQRDDPYNKARHSVRWDFADLGFAARFHIECEPPPLLRIAASFLTEKVAGDDDPESPQTDVKDEVLIYPESYKPPSRIVHIAWKANSLFSTARFKLVLVPRNDGIVLASIIAACGVCAFLWFVVAIRHIRTEQSWSVSSGSPSVLVSLSSPAAAAALVATAGVLLTWLARTPEDVIVGKVLAIPRIHLVVAALCLLLAACLIVLPVPEPHRTTSWVVLAIGSTALAGAAIVFRLRAMFPVNLTRYLDDQLDT